MEVKLTDSCHGCSVAKQIEFFTSIQSEWCGHQKGSTAARPE